MAYSKKVLDRFYGVLNSPQQFSVGRFDPKDPNVATGMTGAPACGDVMKLQLKLDENERIIDVKFKTYGCGSAIASSTMFVDMLKGLTIEEAKKIKDKDLFPLQNFITSSSIGLSTSFITISKTLVALLPSNSLKYFLMLLET